MKSTTTPTEPPTAVPSTGRRPPSDEAPPTRSRPLYAAGRVVASLEPDGTLRRVVRPHQVLRRPPAIAFDVRVIAKAEQLGCRRIVCDVSGDSYAVTLTAFLGNAFPVNRGHGDQLALHLDSWCITSAGVYTLSLQGFLGDDAE